MATRRDEWDARYREREACCAPVRPASILLEALPLLPRGRALDIAAGAGANAVFLAENGWQVTAVDFSSTGLAFAERLAEERGVACLRAGKPGANARLRPPGPGVTLVCADLEKIHLPVASFDFVLCLRYLERSLFPQLVRALRRHGVLLYETYTLEQLRFLEGPHNPAHLLRPGELREAFPLLEILFCRELAAGMGIASLLARKP
jgi:tellurite methyltransferase